MGLAPYNHSARTVEDATGVNLRQVFKRAEAVSQYAIENKFATLSQLIEQFEKEFNKRELAVLLTAILVWKDPKTENVDNMYV